MPPQHRAKPTDMEREAEREANLKRLLTNLPPELEDDDAMSPKKWGIKYVKTKPQLVLANKKPANDDHRWNMEHSPT